MASKKESKHLMERRRRARINESLSHLKLLVVGEVKRKHVRLSKMDKADILEMAVEYVKKVREQSETQQSGGEPIKVDRYRAGFNACADVLQSHLDQLPQINNDCRARLMDHLANFIQNKQWFAQHLQNACLPLQFVDAANQARRDGNQNTPDIESGMGASTSNTANRFRVESPSSTVGQMSPSSDRSTPNISGVFTRPTSYNHLSQQPPRLGSDVFSPHSDGFSSASERLSIGSDRSSIGSNRSSLGSNRSSFGSGRSSFGSDTSSRFSLGSGFTSPDLDRRLSSSSERLSLSPHQVSPIPNVNYPPRYTCNSTRSCTITSSQETNPTQQSSPIDLSRPKRVLSDTTSKSNSPSSQSDDELLQNVTQRKRIKLSQISPSNSDSGAGCSRDNVPEGDEKNKENNRYVLPLDNFLNGNSEDDDDESMWRPW